MATNRKLRNVVSSVALASTLGAPVLGQHLEPQVGSVSEGLSASEAAAVRDQLLALADRINTEEHSGRSTTVVISPANECGDFMMTAVLDQRSLQNWVVGPEVQLSISGEVKGQEMLRNPSRPRLSQYGIDVNRPNTDFIVRDGAEYLGLSLNSTLDDSPDLASTLFVDNDDGGLHLSDAKPGRGLDVAGITQRAFEGCPYTERQLHVFELMQHTARSFVGDSALANSSTYNKVITVAPSARENEYVIDLVAYDFGVPTRKRIAQMGVDLSVSYDSGGKLSTGVMSVDMGRTHGRGETTIPDKQMVFYQVHPQDRGVVWDFSDPGFRLLAYDSDQSAAGDEIQRAIDFQQLLFDTTWRRP